MAAFDVVFGKTKSVWWEIQVHQIDYEKLISGLGLLSSHYVTQDWRMRRGRPLPESFWSSHKRKSPTLGWDGDNIKHPPISSFITPESWLLFNLLQIETSDWLEVLCNLPCSMWDKVQEYIKVEVYVTNLSCVALINNKVKTNKPGGEQKLLDLL